MIILHLMNEKLIEYINEQKNNGYSDQQIKNILLKAGYQKKDFIKYFKKKPLLFFNRKVVFFLLILLIFISIFLIINQFNKYNYPRYTQKASEYLLMNDTYNAKKYLTLSRKYGQNDPDHLMKIGNLYEEIGFLSKAVQYYNKSIAISDEDLSKYDKSEIYSKIGMVYLINQEYHNSIKFYTKALAENSYSDKAYSGLGWANLYLDMKNKNNNDWFNKSLEFFNLSISINKNNYIAYLGKGKIYYELKEYEKTIYYTKKGLDIINQSNLIETINCKGYARIAKSYKFLNNEEMYDVYRDKALNIDKECNFDAV